jgi:hypothetical protein
MSNKALLDAEGHLVTAMGKAFLSERVVMRGKDLHHDLGDMSWFALHLYGITGRYFAENELKLLNYLWVATSYPDPSIWPNNTAALAGSVRATASLAMSAGLVTSEASLFGVKPLKKVQAFFLRAKQERANGRALADIIEDEIKINGIVYGYGRPLVSIDERVPHTIRKVQELGFADGECFQMSLEINEYLIKTRQIAMNIAALDGALGADLGFTPEEFHLYMNLIVYAGQPACYLDAISRPEGSFFPMRCSNIIYGGVARRKWAD